MEEQASNIDDTKELVAGMLDILSFVDSVDESMMKLRITADIVKEMFKLIEEAAELVLKVAMAGSWKGKFFNFMCKFCFLKAFSS